MRDKIAFLTRYEKNGENYKSRLYILFLPKIVTFQHVSFKMQYVHVWSKRTGGVNERPKKERKNEKGGGNGDDGASSDF